MATKTQEEQIKRFISFYGLEQYLRPMNAEDKTDEEGLSASAIHLSSFRSNAVGIGQCRGEMQHMMKLNGDVNQEHRAILGGPPTSAKPEIAKRQNITGQTLAKPKTHQEQIKNDISLYGLEEDPRPMKAENKTDEVSSVIHLSSVRTEAFVGMGQHRERIQYVQLNGDPDQQHRSKLDSKFTTNKSNSLKRRHEADPPSPKPKISKRITLIKSEKDRTREVLQKSKKRRDSMPRERLVQMEDAVRRWNANFGTEYTIF